MNLKIANSQKLFVREDMKVLAKARNSVGCITFRLPFVSARNPQRCDPEIMPRIE